MKICHLGPSALPVLHPLGGATQRRIAEIAKSQLAQGDRVTIYSAGSQSSRWDWNGVEIRTLACRRGSPLRDFEFMAKARKELRNERFDILHFHSLPEGAVFSNRIGKKILSFDNFFFRRGKKTPLYFVYRQILRKFSCLLPVSDYCRRQYEEYWGTNGVPIRVIHNGVNLNQFVPDAAAGSAKKRALGMGDKPVILYVGRVCEQKGTDVLIEAYELLRRSIPEVRLVVAGPAEQFGTTYQTLLTRRISQAGGLYLGPVPESDLSAVYNLCDVFVMPTRSVEMFGMAAVEAQACGKPVVCSRHGGLTEVISETSGMFFPVGDPAALADCLLHLLRQQHCYRLKAAAARRNAARFGWHRVAARVREAYCGC